MLLGGEGGRGSGMGGQSSSWNEDLLPRKMAAHCLAACLLPQQTFLTCASLVVSLEYFLPHSFYDFLQHI